MDSGDVSPTAKRRGLQPAKAPEQVPEEVWEQDTVVGFIVGSGTGSMVASCIAVMLAHMWAHILPCGDAVRAHLGILSWRKTFDVINVGPLMLSPEHLFPLE